MSNTGGKVSDYAFLQQGFFKLLIIETMLIKSNVKAYSFTHILNNQHVEVKTLFLMILDFHGPCFAHYLFHNIPCFLNVILL